MTVVKIVCANPLKDWTHYPQVTNAVESSCSTWLEVGSIFSIKNCLWFVHWKSNSLASWIHAGQLHNLNKMNNAYKHNYYSFLCFSSLIEIFEILWCIWKIKGFAREYFLSTDYPFLFIDSFDPQSQLTICVLGAKHLIDMWTKGQGQLGFPFNKASSVECLLVIISNFSFNLQSIQTWNMMNALTVNDK